MSFDVVEYAEALDEFLMRMERISDHTNPDVHYALERICELLKIAKLQACFCKQTDEQKKHTIEVNFLQKGEAEKDVYIRQSEQLEEEIVVDYIAYHKAGAAEWTQTEQDKIRILIKMVRVFNERERNKQLVEAFMLRDKENARNVGKEVHNSEELIKNMKEIRKIENTFYEAIKKEEFQVYYQPKVLLKNYKLTGAEALCRWMHDGELLPPGKFIPTLEQSNAICVLDFYMLEHVCMDIRKWMDEGRKIVKVSINLSRRHLGNPHLLENILEIVDKHNVPHEYIEIELTETTTDVSFHELKEIVFGLHEKGISTSVDDFGIGYSSLNLIRQLPWNVIKIDRSFLQTDNNSINKNYTMLKYVIALVQDLGMECIVEGVETAEHVKILKENNCYLAQGFYFDRPLPKEDFEIRLLEYYE